MVTGGNILEVEVVERFWQPQKLRLLLLQRLVGWPLAKDQVDSLGLPSTLAEELTTLLD